MVSKAALLALAASSIVSAQTFTSCNPLKKTCPSDPAFGKNQVSCDFSKGDCDVFTKLPGTTIDFKDNGAVFTINKVTDAPTIVSGKYLFFGRVDVVVQAAAGVGVVTSSVLQSDDLDEIDWEWVGGDNGQAQSNYFSKGDTTTYNRGAFHPVANPTGQFHTYSVIWTSQMVQWLIDDQVVRTLTAAEANGGAALPQTPMQVKLGTWVAGSKTASPGTVQWAGGLTDFSQAPFIGYYKSVSIVDYAGADAPTSKSVREYIYGDYSGTWESIKVVEGEGSDSSSSTSKGHSSTSSHSSGSHSSTDSHSATNSIATATTDSGSDRTTFTTAVVTATSSATPGSGSNSTTPAGTGSATSRPSTVPQNAGSRGAVAMGSVLAAGAGVMLAQLFL